MVPFYYLSQGLVFGTLALMITHGDSLYHTVLPEPVSHPTLHQPYFPGTFNPVFF
jgi:hypothetical protein